MREPREPSDDRRRLVSRARNGRHRIARREPREPTYDRHIASNEEPDPTRPNSIAKGSLPLRRLALIRLAVRLLSRRKALAIGPRDQHRHFKPVPHAIDRLAQQQVANHAVPVRADDQQVDRMSSQMRTSSSAGFGPCNSTGLAR